LALIIDKARRETLYDDAIDERQFASAAVPLIRVAFPALAGRLNDDDEELRSACTLALAKGGSIAVGQLLQALASDDAAIREAAVIALIRLEPYLPKQRPLPPNIERVHARMIPLIVTSLQNDAQAVQRASVRLFVALEIGADGAEAEPHLRRALQTGDLTTRRYADRALKRLTEEN
jgi:HEAT repeat protein